MQSELGSTRSSPGGKFRSRLLGRSTRMTSRRLVNPAIGVLLLMQLGLADVVAHEGFEHHFVQASDSNQPASATRKGVEQSEAGEYLDLFKSLIARWPTQLTDRLINQCWQESLFVQRDTHALSVEDLRKRRQVILDELETLLPSIPLDWDGSTATIANVTERLTLCRGIASPVLVAIENRSDTGMALHTAPQVSAPAQLGSGHVHVAAGATRVLACEVLIPRDANVEGFSLRLVAAGQASKAAFVEVPIRAVEPATLRGTVVEDDRVQPARLTVVCSDGVCRYGGAFANESTFTDKPIIYPPIQGSRKTSFFYADDTFELLIPPGETTVYVERGFEYKISKNRINARANVSHELKLSCERLIDMATAGWVSGDTHVHWVTNQWNVDEPLELLAMVQRAEGLRVANNLTLLQRYADQAFIKPSQAPMGPVSAYSDSRFHVQMGEEYRNEDLYGHLCFLNIDWLVQPIGTGSIIAGPDALDYPINRTAIDACRQQGGISIEAHGTGGNKDVPVNVIHNLADSLDQMEPASYYRLLDCGFRIPLTNGSDHPARTLGVARAYVNVEGSFSYDRWIEGIRQGRTFTTSGPLLFLKVNDAEIGDVINTGTQDRLRITAQAISRHPIGEFQIVSNGEVIASESIDTTSAEIELTIPAEESRWIVARCSNRSDGRSDFGFGNFNAITGPGIAHTSPVYVHVDGLPRFDSAAADFWAERMRMHALDIRRRGRFADEVQRNEAASYIEQGIQMFRSLENQVESGRTRAETLDEAKSRLSNVLRRFGDREDVKAALLAIADVNSRSEFANALEPLVLVSASINPESRVKIESTRPRIEMRQGKPHRFLVKVENTAGVTAPLQIETIDLATSPPRPAMWCDVNIVDSPLTSVFLTGAESEYKVIELFVREAGLKEVRLTANVGQGTQDLGFRATADLLINARPRTSVTEN